MPVPETATKTCSGNSEGRLRRRTAVLTGAFVALALSAMSAKAQDWPMFQGDPLHAGLAPNPIALPLSISWRHVTRRPISGVNLASPIVTRSLGTEPVGFFAARDMIASVRVGTGEARWYYPKEGNLGFGKQASIRTTPLYANGTVYAGATDGNLYAVQANTGALLWQFPTPGNASITGSPIVVNGQIFFGTDRGAIIGLDAKTGKPIGSEIELFRAADAVVGSLAYADGFIYFVSRDQSVYALDLNKAIAPQEGRKKRRVIRWQYTLAAPPSYSSPVIAKELLYIADGDSIVALTLSRGRRRWSFQADRAVSDTPAVTEQGIFFGTREGSFYGLDLAGKQKWKSETAGPAYASPVVARIALSANSLMRKDAPKWGVFVGSNRGFVYCLNVDDGRPLWIYKIRPADPVSTTVTNVVASPVVLGNQLLVLADDGSLLAFSPAAVDRTPPLIWNELPDRATEISGRPPITYSINVADDGSGIDPDSIVLSVDGRKLDYTYDEYRGLIYYKVSAAKAGSREPVQPLPAGRHQVHAEVADWKGNRAVKDWSFPVNNSISDLRPLPYVRE